MANNPYLVRALQAGPGIVGTLVRLADPAVYDRKTDPDRFSFREAVAHVADWEPIMLGRLRQAKENPGSVLAVYDEDQLALEHEYSSTDPLAELEKWVELRAETIGWIVAEAPGAWDSTVTHAERGPQTLYDLAFVLLAHDTYHILQLSEYL